MEDFLAPPKSPAKRNFQRKFALRRNKTESLLLGTKIVRKRFKPGLTKSKNESAQIFRGTLDWYCTANLDPQGSLRGRGPSVWERVQRKPFRRVFFGVFFLLQSVFFLGRPRKKMRLDQLAGFCQNQNGACRRARQERIRPRSGSEITASALPAQRYTQASCRSSRR